MWYIVYYSRQDFVGIESAIDAVHFNVSHTINVIRYVLYIFIYTYEILLDTEF